MQTKCQNFTNNKNDSTQLVYAKKRRNTILNKKVNASISTTLSGVISQARSFLPASCGTLGRC